MQSQALRLTSLFRTTVLAFLITSAALPLPAQNSVPASAVQAAKMPQYAGRLARPVSPAASRPNSTPRLGTRSGPPQNGEIYDNGPTNGTTDAWVFNFGFVVSDSFTVANTTVTGMSFAAWLSPGDILELVEISITSQPNGGTVYFDQTINFTQSGCVSNQYGFNVCTETSATFSGPALNAGTYWVNLENAVTNTGDPVYWDENSGPSQAYDSSVGTIPSESFTLLGGGGGGEPTCYQSQGNLQIIYNFTQQQGFGSGVAIDRAGNLYGPTPFGNNNDGFVYKLANFGSWLLDPLFNFLGGSNGDQPTGAIIGPNGSLYGGAQGGIQNCGSDGTQYCGLVYNLRPKATFCATTLCGWNENVPYRFSSETDGAGVVTVSAFDQAGNLYGTTSAGGTHDAGTVFELTPSGGGWTKTTLYSFTGRNDGSGPTQVLVGNDGNLYGVAGGGAFHGGVVFQMTPSGGQWTESVVHPFGFEGDFGPIYVVQDSATDLFGIAHNSRFTDQGLIFALEKTGSGWVYSSYIVQHDNEFDFLNNLTIDAGGNLYGTGNDLSTFSGSRKNMNPGGGIVTYDSYIFKASHGSDGWHYQDLRYLSSQYFTSSGILALDLSGNLYGTTYDCGTNSSGTVWQFSQ
jgi:uncharacterized repeat protein (TIGR03803 family)